MLAQTAATTNTETAEMIELRADHAALVRRVELVKVGNPEYAGPEGFHADFDIWLANLDSKIQVEQDAEFAHFDDMADWQASTTSGVLAF